MLNYVVNPALLAARVPAGTELDAWEGKTYLSVVGFLFQRTRVLGVPIPFHCNFEEINLRFYVRRASEEGWRRGVVFVKEIVPRAAIAAVARWLYNENYVACPMRSQAANVAGDEPGLVEYAWKHAGNWTSLRAEISGEPETIAPGSEEEFITEHFWGYSSQPDGTTLEYQVEHPSWKVWAADTAIIDGDPVAFYGSEFADTFASEPSSTFVADGSHIIVRKGRRIC